jgi:hypothetical protein
MLLKILFFLAAAMAPLGLTMVLLLASWLLLGVAGAVFFAPVSYLPIFAILGPLSMGLGYAWFVRAVRYEARLCRELGRTDCAWVSFDFELSSFTEFFSLNPARYLFTEMWRLGQDVTGDHIKAWLDMVGWAPEWAQASEAGLQTLGSHLWYEMVMFADEHLPSTLLHAALLLATGTLTWRFLKAGFSIIWVFTWWWYVFLVFLWHLDFDVIFRWMRWFFVVTVSAAHRKDALLPIFVEWVKWRVTAVLVTVALAVDGLNSEVNRHYSAKIAGGRRTFAAVSQQFILRSVTFISDVSLPEFVRRRFSWQVNEEEVLASRAILKDLGWPVNVEPAEPAPDSTGRIRFTEWLIGGSDLRTGIRQSKTYVDESLALLRASAPSYQRTESYQTTANELDSTSRYFLTKEVVGMEPDLDDVWLVLKDIFAHSRLTPFNKIISLWEKKYALGFWMKDPDKPVKYNRRKFISSIGFSRFKQLWAKTFYWASQILPVAHISVKGEPLPEKKWSHGLVRSIIGSPISQYILSTIFAHGPNHQFAWETTPVKVGMPLNGYWLGSVFKRHARFQVHVEGDFTAFDSTLHGPVIDMIKAIRKRGYDFHKDREAICDLIDINYDQVSKQVLGMTSTGNYYRKGTGLTTGHSSTSMDNSVALVVFYLTAWKKLTGKSAREFLFYNELSCYGDDHVLSFPHIRPMSWNPKNIARVMKDWGVMNNVVSKPLEQITFLSKRCRRARPGDIAEMRELGLPNPGYIVWHDRDKLVGKMTAPLKNVNPTYKLKRLLSYLSLTAHHRDVYDQLHAIITESRTMQMHLKELKLQVPTYKQVVTQWYAQKPGPEIEDPDSDDEALKEGKILVYGQLSALDAILGALSMVPDLLNPSVFNFGLGRSVQLWLGRHLAWVGDLMIRVNPTTTVAGMAWVLKSTPYSFLDPALFLPGPAARNLTTLLVRHWLFCLYCHLVPSPRTPAYLDFVLRKLASIQFLINGKVMADLPRGNVSLDRALIAAALDVVQLPDFLPDLTILNLPDLGKLIDLLMNRVLSWVWSSVPANFNEINPALRALAPGEPLLIEAPTGTGKSTTMMVHLWNIVKGSSRRVVVVVPRSILAIGLADYVTKTFGVHCSAGTSGVTLDREAKIWYMTPQSLFANLHLMESDFVFVIDECHVDEPAVRLAIKLCVAARLKLVWTTATPSEANKKGAVLHIPIPIVSLWSVEHRIVSSLGTGPSGYINRVKDLAASAYGNRKVLYILDTPEQAEECARVARLPCQVLSSKHSPIVRTDVALYFATTVVDVGITLPGLDEVVSPDWEYDGQMRYALSPALRRQRAGRTGRTCNGLFTVVADGVVRPSKPPVTDLNAAMWRNLLASGFPVALAAKIDRDRMLSALGLNPDMVKEEDMNGILRASSLFLQNLQPALMANYAANRANMTGERNVTLQHTGAGKISTSNPQGDQDLAEQAVDATAYVLRSALGLDVEKSQEEAYAKFDMVAGPLVNASRLGAALIKDMVKGIFVRPNPRNRMVPMPSSIKFQDALELPKIVSLLNEVSNLTASLDDQDDSD